MGRGRRAAFAAALLVATWAAAEGVAWLGLWWSEGRSFSPARAHAERREILDEEALFAPPAERAAAPGWLKEEILHPYLGYVRNPGPDPRGGPPVNEYGFVGEPPPLQTRAPGRLIVGVFGGSVARSFALGGAPVLKAELRRSPRLIDREIVVVNTAVRGYKQPQQLMALGYLLALGAEFDVVVNLDGFNEVVLHPTRNAPQGVAPTFPTNWALRVEDLPDPAQQRLLAEVVNLRRARGELAGRVEAAPWRLSPLLNLLWRLRDAGLETRLREAQVQFEYYRPPERSREATGPGPTRAEPAELGEMLDELIDLWSNASLQMHRLTKANGGRYLHFLQPNQYVPDSKALNREEQVWALREPNRELVAAGYARLRPAGEALRAAGVDFHDLTRVFADVEETIYVDACCHVNARGNEILARSVARAILAPGTAGPP